MNYTIKKTVLLLIFPLFLNSCIVQNPSPEDCEVKEITVAKIYEGGVKDVVFKEANEDFYFKRSSISIEGWNKATYWVIWKKRF